METWKDIPGFEGEYQASDAGRIRSLDHYVKVRGGKRLIRGKGLRLFTDKDGYKIVEVKGKSRRVHRLIAMTFVERVNGKEYVNHKDGDKGNNNINNLEWCTASENKHHAHEVLGLTYFGRRGASVVCVETGKKFVSKAEAARWCGIINPSNINVAIARGITAGGYHWKGAK